MQIVIVEDNVRFAEQVIHTLNRFFTEKEEDAEICQMEWTGLHWGREYGNAATGSGLCILRHMRGMQSRVTM